MGNLFAGYYVGIKEAAGGKSEIWFNDFLMGELDETTGQISPFNASKKQQDIYMAGVLPMSSGCTPKTVQEYKMYYSG